MAKKQLGEVRLTSIVGSKIESLRANKPEQTQELLNNFRRQPEQYPVQNMEPVQRVEPVQKQNPVHAGAGTHKAPRPKPALGSGTFQRLIEVFDQLLMTLEPSEQVVFLQLYRLSFGFGRDTCEIGLPRLATRCNMALNTARKARNALIDKGYIELVETQNTGTKAGGTIYRVYLDPGAAFKPRPDIGPGSKMIPGASSGPAPDSAANMIHDDKHENGENHRSETMRTYTELTGNPWNPAVDLQAYEQIKHIPVADIQSLMRAIYNDAKTHPGTFAFFSTSILKRLQQGTKGKPRQSKVKRDLKRIRDELRELDVGSQAYTDRDFRDTWKDKALREGVPWIDDIVNEIMGL